MTIDENREFKTAHKEGKTCASGLLLFTDHHSYKWVTKNMKLWIDNTSLHSAAHCLDENARDAIDIRGLFQLALEIIFADQIVINGFESSSVAERTSELRSKLIDLGLNKTVFTITSVDVDSFRNSCTVAANEVAKDITIAFNTDASFISALEPDLSSSERNINDSFHDFIVNTRSSAKMDEMTQRAFSSNAPGATHYMVSHSTQLLGEIQKMVRSTTRWTPEHSRQLGAFLRLYLNDTLAKQNDCIYAPAVARATLLRAANRHILGQLMSEVNKVFRQRFEQPIILPALLGPLVDRSKGETGGFIKETCAVREKCEPIRQWISDVALDFYSDNPTDRWEAEQKLAEVGSVLRKELGIEKASKLRDAIDLTFVFGLPSVKVSGKNLMDWLEHRRHRKKFAVLTELSKEAAIGANPLALHRLITACTRRSNKRLPDSDIKSLTSNS